MRNPNWMPCVNEGRKHEDDDSTTCGACGRTHEDPSIDYARCGCGEDTIIGCGSRPDRCCGLNADEDIVTITISREDAEFYAKPAAILELLQPYLVRLNQACRAALEGER